MTCGSVRVDMCNVMPWPRNISNFYVGFWYLLRVPYRSWRWIISLEDPWSILQHFAAIVSSYQTSLADPRNRGPGMNSTVLSMVQMWWCMSAYVCVSGVMGVETKQPAEQSSKVEKRTQTDTVEMDPDGDGKIPILVATSSLMLSCFFPTAIPIQKRSLNQP